MPQIVYQIKALRFERVSADAVFTLEVPDLTVKRGERIALLGPSGCGKSTLLDLLSLIALPDKAVQFDFSPTQEIQVPLASSAKSGNIHNRLARLRKYHIGYILQTGGLLPFLNIEANIKICQELTGKLDKDWLLKLATRLEIERHFKKKPGALSTGERQRVAVARALAHKPSVVIADEPTAALDPSNADKVLELLVSLTDQLDATLLLATHDSVRLERFEFKRLSQRFGEDTTSKTVLSIFEDCR